ncbi:hypothetical protein DFJ74DRAFT_703572 [Hyaloraphidium curvatum]|nr:hypothetical protein DFJ74DRAFT_703572 [Hyaloraphidium curvatum]
MVSRDPSTGEPDPAAETSPDAGDESDVEDPYPEMDVDAAIRFLIEDDGATRVPPHILLGPGYGPPSAGGETGDGHAVNGRRSPPGIRQINGAEHPDSDSDEAPAQDGDFGYEPLPDGGSDAGDAEEGWAGEHGSGDPGLSEPHAIFTVERDLQEASAGAELSSGAPSAEAAAGRSLDMDREDQNLIKAVMNGISLPAPAWAADGAWEARMEEMVADLRRRQPARDAAGEVEGQESSK